MEAASNAGAPTGLTATRLNGQIGDVFENWVEQAFPERADKIIIRLRAHVANSTIAFGNRMRGEGKMVQSIPYVRAE